MPTGERGEAAANGNAIYRGDAGLRVRTGRVGREHTVREHGGTRHGGTDDGSSHRRGHFYPAPQRLD